MPDIKSSSSYRSKPLGQQPMFDDSVDLHVFKMLFKEWVELNDWNNDVTITQWLKQCLTGAAKMNILYDYI